MKVTVIIMFIACRLSILFASSYDISLAKWTELKGSRGDCYTYTRSFVSWVGFGSRTIIKVEQGVVVERTYEAFDSSRTITSTYHESTPQEIGTNSQGQPAKTMDELYTECPSYLALDEQTNYIYFRVDDLGILQLCGYVPQGCMDDCFQGISVSSFEFCN
mmetsp:Transcript_29839/g.47597  ORF Transcript_29839/g.47597 Transcript_29839/m.47597 type:complete len:161 (-) Transcript_29839:165-647(-)